MSFVNRVNDVKQLMDALQTSPRKNNKVFFIVARSGVGKSGYTQKLMSMDHFENRLKIRMKKTGDSKEQKNGDYLHRIAKVIDQISINSPENISLHTYTDFAKSRVLLKSAIKYFFNKNGMIDNLNDMNLNDSNLTIIKQYITATLETNNSVICIENYNFIDDDSHEFLLELVKTSKNNIFLFECTSYDNDYDTMIFKYHQQYKELDINVFLIELPDLKLDECLEICVNKGIDVGSSDVEYFKLVYSEARGNLYKIIHFRNASISRSFTYKNFQYDTSYQLIKSLQDLDQYLILIIAMNQGEMSKEILRLLYDKWPWKVDLLAFENSINKMETLNILVIDHTKVRLHDSVKKIVIEFEGFEKFRTLCYKTIVDLYSEIIQNGSHNLLLKEKYNLDDLYGTLVELYEKFDMSQLIQLITNFDIYVTENHSDSLTVKFIESIITKKIENEKLQEKIHHFILRKAYAIGRLDYIKVLYDQNSVKYNVQNLVYFSLALGHLGLYKESELVIGKITERYSSANARKEFLVLLLKQINILYFETREHAIKFSLEIIDSNKFNEIPEYGLFLRNYATLLPVQNAISLIENSISLLERNKLINDSYQTHITLGIRYAFLNEFDKARKKLNFVTREIGEIGFRKYYVSNNLAVLDIMENKCTYQTEQLLLLSLNLVKDYYEMICIQTNLLAYYCIVDDIINSKLWYEKISKHDVSMFKGEDFIYTYYNALVQYAHQYSSVLAEAHIFDACMAFETSQNKSFQNEIINKLRNGTSNSVDITDSHYIIKKYRFDPVMLSYWGFDIHSDIMNS